MKEISELSFPEDVRYTENHEWARELGGRKIQVGITDYAQDQLGDIVFVELPELGVSYKQAQEFGTLESVKAVASIYMPAGGKVVTINEALADAPQMVNQTPFTDGWIAEVEMSDPAELGNLMDRDAYLEMVKGTK